MRNAFFQCFKKDFYPDIDHNALEYTPFLIAFRMKFETLSTPAKDSLIKAYPIFGRLDEVQAYATVFEAIIGNVKRDCARNCQD
ncbi:hypothetical protein PRIPAC_71552 [Pristionchus pacificus]|uniref:Uncharacterized protein n=1 Tax=Pristionchus pacificus TaxID=54126 RepID=A0A2A6C0M4_PRIPA|nr:hypothetical protein PRIPAC_71552 [Pristionchus pacificus]|eukprot:PDM71581.1 hypothetical protein PRIPAC_37988 [Pristionchus pacificus]